MREISHSVYIEAHGPVACVRGGTSSTSFFDREGLENLIFSLKARGQDTRALEEQHDVLATAETMFPYSAPTPDPASSRV